MILLELIETINDMFTPTHLIIESTPKHMFQSISDYLQEKDKTVLSSSRRWSYWETGVQGSKIWREGWYRQSWSLDSHKPARPVEEWAGALLWWIRKFLMINHGCFSCNSVSRGLIKMHNMPSPKWSKKIIPWQCKKQFRATYRWRMFCEIRWNNFKPSLALSCRQLFLVQLLG